MFQIQAREITMDIRLHRAKLSISESSIHGSYVI